MKFVPRVIGKKMLFWIIKLLSLWNMKDFGYLFIESWQNNLRERTGEYHLDYIELYAMLYIFYAILVITWTSHAKECLGNMSFIFHTFHKSQIPCKKNEYFGCKLLKEVSYQAMHIISSGLFKLSRDKLTLSHWLLNHSRFLKQPLWVIILFCSNILCLWKRENRA